MEIISNSIVEAEDKQGAFLDAKRRNAIMINTFEFDDIEKAILLKEELSHCYDFFASYISYRKKFISIKFDGARIKNYTSLSKKNQ